MATLTEDMKQFINDNLAFVATVSADGVPDLGPKMSMFALDDNHLAYHERTGGQTYRNLENGSPLVVAFVNFEQKKGYRFRGEVVLHTDDAIYDEQVKLAEQRGTKKPACVPVMEIDQIEDLSAGAHAYVMVARSHHFHAR
ncbi:MULTISPECIES: pyridoxamine 5'-phosphate oxidase family protein [Bifidobacterium]|uniref:Flavin-nucleotide-binding protein n=1 Tax=Bifidobacterium pseudolongum subsp. globosum TaxID=1690 RepID=A0A2N3QQM2_9BIFI|nr:pyridoxamine 5'-phosphate oxidase family protein [Bifidobacterium pseudolongum]PKU93964.1 flavin-nucleotide-binding protein [Bifidobacterium pseudolongum subsp. globosum]